MSLRPALIVVTTVLVVLILLATALLTIVTHPDGPGWTERRQGQSNGANHIIGSGMVHQTWKNTNLSPSQQQSVDSWRRDYPDLGYRLWTDPELQDFMQKELPWYMPVFDRLDPFIKKVDCVRYAWMWLYGGVYADIDMMSVTPRDIPTDAALIPAGRSSATWSHDADMASPAFLSSNPGNQVWLYMLAYIARNTHRDTLRCTGPIGLANTLRALEKSGRMRQLDVIFVSEASMGLGRWKSPIVSRLVGRPRYASHLNAGTWVTPGSKSAINAPHWVPPDSLTDRLNQLVTGPMPEYFTRPAS
jgi:hypothetical protein